MTALILGLLGLIIGSFLNVLVLRRGVSSLGGRSYCMSCGAQISWYDNIPVVSWLVLRGRCRHCGSAISVQYPLVEATTGILFALIGANYDISTVVLSGYTMVFLALSCAVAALLIAIAVYDVLHTIIPDAWVYVFAALALVYGIFFSPLPHTDGMALFLAAGPLASAPLYALWAISRGRWMGLGDAKLALGMGWLLGPWSGLFSVFLAFILGALFSIPLLVRSSQMWASFARFIPIRSSRVATAKVTMKSEIPFGPFLIASCIIVWLSLLHGVEPLVFLGLMPLQ